MGRTFLSLGFAILAVAVWLLLGGAVGWVDPATADTWGPPALKIAIGSAALGFVLRLLSPVQRALKGSRCARCGRPTDRGQLYCYDHLKLYMDEARDRTRDGMLPPPRKGRSAAS